MIQLPSFGRWTIRVRNSRCQIPHTPANALQAMGNGASSPTGFGRVDVGLITRGSDALRT